MRHCSHWQIMIASQDRRYMWSLKVIHIYPKVIPYESTIPTYMRYLPAVPSKFVCAKLQTFKWNSILYARIAHVSTRVVNIFHARWVILMMSGHRSSFTRKWQVTGMPSPMLKSNKNICKQNCPGIVVSWIVPVVLDHPWSVLVGGGGL